MRKTDKSKPEAAENIVRQVQALWDRNRLCCGWFFREGFKPETVGDLRRCLRAIEKHGDRSAYVHARKLGKCL